MREKQVPLYSIQDFLEKSTDDELYANTFSDHLQHDFILKSHRHNFYLCVLFTAGTGSHEIDFHVYPINPGSIFFIQPGQVHTWQLSVNIEGYIFFHTKQFFDLSFTVDKVLHFPFYRSIHNTSLLLLREDNLLKIEAIYKEIVHEYKSDELMKFKKLRSLIYWLYVELSRLYIPEKIYEVKNSTARSRFLELEELIDAKFKTIKFPKDYAELMHLSEQQLNRICKTCTGHTVSQLIINRVLLEAKRMLAYSDSTVAEVAFDLGYTDTSYFNRFFKKNVGNTPLEFVRKNKKSDV